MKDCIKNDIDKLSHKEIIINAALLLPMNLNILCHKVVSVVSNFDDIIKRGIERDNRNLKQIKFILSNQPTTKQLNEIADYIIKNDGSINMLIRNCKQVIEKIRLEQKNVR